MEYLKRYQTNSKTENYQPKQNIFGKNFLNEKKNLKIKVEKF